MVAEYVCCHAGIGPLSCAHISTVPHTNLSTIRTFIVSMILSSIDDADADSWTAALTSYQELLKAHSAGFPVARHAVAQAEQLPLNTNETTPQSSP